MCNKFVDLVTFQALFMSLSLDSHPVLMIEDLSQGIMISLRFALTNAPTIQIPSLPSHKREPPFKLRVCPCVT